MCIHHPQYVSDIPHLYTQWDSKKNGGFLATEATLGMGRKVWWLCELGHSWEAKIAARGRGSGCPFCSNQKILAGFNDLAHLAPEIAQQWDQEKNGTPTPATVGKGSSKKVWWICDAHHSWEATVASRTKMNSGCPFCSGKRIIPGETDLATTHPHLALQWNWEKNGEFTPGDISAGSEKKVWWCCDLGHSYQMSIYNKTAHKPQGCPYCSHKKLLAGFNDLATTHPTIATQWDQNKNGMITPDSVMAGSGRKVWWLCDLGHSWEATILNRKNGSGCPYCSGLTVTPGVSDLAATHPELIQQWDWKKNTGLIPGELSSGSRTKAWWLCDLGHSWKASIANRSKGIGCPYCSGNLVLPGFNDLSTVNPELSLQWDQEKNRTLTPDMVTAGSGKKVWWLCDLGHSWQSRIADRQRFGCPQCIHPTSTAEREIAYFVSLLVGAEQIRTSDRQVISPYELDLYIPSKNIAIEYNGIYWHTESQGKGKWYHHAKWKACAEQGIQLITVWEDEWRDKPEVVKSMLSHKLGVSTGKKVFARKTFVTFIDHLESADFLNRYHIQGRSQGSIHIGLKDSTGELVAVSVWKKNKDVLRLERYATSCTVVGGMGKLLKAGCDFGRKKGCSKIVTFSDHCVSDGNLYSRLGFSHDGMLSPDYRYVVKGERKHKFGYRLKRFHTDPELFWEEGLSERELAKLNGLERIWDCGKTRWVMSI